MLVLGGAVAGCKREDSASPPPVATTAALPDADVGAMLYSKSCLTCHGSNCQGLIHHGPDLRRDAFFASHTDEELIAFARKGRAIKDPDNKTGVAMPPGGGIPGFGSDPQGDTEYLADIIAFIRRVQSQTKQQDAFAAAHHPPTTQSLGSAATQPVETPGTASIKP